MMAPTKQTSQKPFQSTTAEPPRRRSTRIPASEIPQPRPRIPIHCTWTNCTASVIHFHPLSRDPQQHFLPRPEYAVDSVEFANPERGSPSQQFDSAQISTTQTMSQSTIQCGPKITKNKQTTSRVIQKVTKSKRARARISGKKIRARDRTDAREERARKQVKRLIEDAETAAGFNHNGRVTATGRSSAFERLPCNRDGLDVIKQQELISRATPMDDPHTPIHHTPEEALTSPPAVSRSPQHKHHGSYMEFQGSPLGLRGLRRGWEPEVKKPSDDALVDEKTNLNDSGQALIDQAPKAEVSSMDGIAVPHALCKPPEKLQDEVESLAGSLYLSQQKDGLPSNVPPTGVLHPPFPAYGAPMDDLLTRPRTSELE